MGRIATYWHTVKYLKPVQIYGRLLHHLPRRTSVAAPPPPPEARTGEWIAPPARPSLSPAPGSFRFLNEERALGWPPDWRAEDASLLWRYNLHYFDDLAVGDATARADYHRDLIESWIEHNPPGSRPAWDSYPTSLRIVNWIKWSLRSGTPSPLTIESLAQQVRWLSRRLEWHLLGNHLFANAKALVFAGCFFRGPEAAAWLDTGASLIARELDEQVLADGANFELSPMYHAIFLADLLDLISLAGAYSGKLDQALVEKLRAKAKAMFEWLALMVHRDGQIAMFNDGAFSIALTLDELAAWGSDLGVAWQRPQNPGRQPTIHLLQPSGYARLETSAAVVLCDVARVGPDHLPGHAHADTLSFELSIGGCRFVVNGGTSRYGTDEARMRERGTAAHSTVTVNNRDSSEVWSGFRVARRARPIIHQCAQGSDAAILRATHDGYQRIDPEVVHERTWRLAPGSLRVEDNVSGPWNTATAQFLLHYQVVPSEMTAGVWRLTRGGQEAVLTVLRGAARLQAACHSLEFGRRLTTYAIVVDLDGTGGAVEISWREAE